MVPGEIHIMQTCSLAHIKLRVGEWLEIDYKIRGQLAEKEKLPLKIVQLDVTDDGSVKNAMQSIIAEASRIDVLVNNAGYSLNGAFEDVAMEELKAQYETNLFGVTRVTQAVLPLMRKQKSGIIVNISSGTVTIGGM
jgi:NADP-dependent 3-hydroxy acid dehydrogenase YdfG